MQISITFRHMEASQAVREYIDTKISHLKKFLIKPTEVHVILSVEKFRHRAEVVLLEQHFKASADETTDDMYKSIDSAMHKIQAQVRKHKQKVQDHHHESMHDVTAQAENDYQKHIDQQNASE